MSEDALRAAGNRLDPSGALCTLETVSCQPAETRRNRLHKIRGAKIFPLRFGGLAALRKAKATEGVLISKNTFHDLTKESTHLTTHLFIKTTKMFTLQ